MCNLEEDDTTFLKWKMPFSELKAPSFKDAFVQYSTCTLAWSNSELSNYLVVRKKYIVLL